MRAHHVRSYGLSVTTTNPTSARSGDHNDVQQYEIRVKGHLSSRWTAWFDGLNVTNEDDGTTVISVRAVDQAALHGLLQKVRDLGIPLVSLTQLPPDASTASHSPKGN